MNSNQTEFPGGVSNGHPGSTTSADFTARLPLSRYAIDRDHLSRKDPGLIDRVLGDPRSLVVVLWNDKALVAPDDRSLALLSPEAAPAGELLLYLGRSTDASPRAFVATVISDDVAATLDVTARWGSLRDVGATLNDRDAGLFTEALALAHWHRSHRFSPRTGRPTESAVGGWVRRADGDSHDLFPRTDAAIIVGVTDDQDRILLGANAMWAANRYSLLAGFVEPGESLEAAVVREVFEESGIRVTKPVYLGSQPWPFPASLMLGFRATVDPDVASTLTPDGEEILDLRWFSREELAASLDSIALPGPTSIARAILEDWFGGPIEDRTQW